MSENRNRNGTPKPGATLTLDWDWPARPAELKAKVLEFLRSNPACVSVHWITIVIHDEAREHESKVTHRMTDLAGEEEVAAFILGLIDRDVDYHHAVVAPEACHIRRVSVVFG
ncbi:MAG: hypothetical protein ACLQDV_26505 [Candidatus Binataceae bacterium]